MRTLRQRLAGFRPTVLTALDDHMRAGEQLASTGAVALGPQQTWLALSQVLVSLAIPDKKREALAQNVWRAPTATDGERARQIAHDCVVIKEAVSNERAHLADWEHMLACVEVEHVLRTFEATVRRLSRRRDKRPPLSIDDEYDVHYLLQGLLAMFFDDVRVEEAVPSMAGANSRIDFFLKQDKIAIEAKATRQGLDDHELGRELLEDLTKYKGHAGVKTLYFFVWDQGHHVRNAAGLVHDVKHEAGERAVHVIFSPPRR